MNTLLLEDLLRLNDKYKNRIKVRFNQSNEIENSRDLNRIIIVKIKELLFI